jgi:hypothetical protein
VETGPFTDLFDPYDARSVIVQGNVILLTYRSDPGKDLASTWYTYHIIDDAPELPIEPLPQPSGALHSGASGLLASGASDDELAANIPNAMTDTPVASSPATAVQPPLEFSKVPGATTAHNPGAPFVMAILPTAAFVVAALVIGGSLRRKR